VAIAVVQNTNNAVGSTSLSAIGTYTNTPTQNNTLIASVGNTTNQSTPTLVSGGNSWQLLAISTDGGASSSVFIFGRVAGASESKTVTASLPGSL
jgi:hypothetical protein